MGTLSFGTCARQKFQKGNQKGKTAKYKALDTDVERRMQERLKIQGAQHKQWNPACKQ